MNLINKNVLIKSTQEFVRKHTHTHTYIDPHTYNAIAYIRTTHKYSIAGLKQGSKKKRKMVQRNGKKNLCKNKQETQTHTHTSARGGQRKNVAKTENAKKERERRKNKNAAATAMMKTKKKHRSRH